MDLLFQVAKEHGGIMRFIQVSCLGASVSSPSRMQRAKAAAEEAVFSALPEVNLSQLLEPKTLSSVIIILIFHSLLL